MKRRRLKSFVIPSIYIMTVIIVFISMVFLGNSLTVEPLEDDINYVIDVVEDDIPVVSEVETKAVKPYLNEEVEISTDYYSIEDESDIQTNSLIYYQNTYLQNTGILYTNKDVFDVVVVYDGVVKNIASDEIMGSVVEITHTNNLSSFYYSLSEVEVKVGETLKTGDLIGKSGDNKIENIEGSSLLLEIYYQGNTIDPNTFYESDIKNFE